VSGLSVLGVIDGRAWLLSWITWWMRDFLGVIIMFPLVMLVYGEPRKVWRKRRMAVAIPMLLAFLVVVTTFIRSTKDEEAEILQSFRLQSLHFSDLIQARLDEQEFLLEQLDAYLSMQTTQPASRQEFRDYIDLALKRFPMIQAIEWVPVVKADQRSSFVQEQQADSQQFDIRERSSDGSMVSAGMRSEYFPVTYVEPMEGNQAAFGFDLASNSARKKAVMKTMTTSAVVATTPLQLVQEEGRQAGILLLKKVSSGANSPGLVLTVLRVGDFLENSLTRQGDMSIGLTDVLENKVIYGPAGLRSVDIVFENMLEYGGRQYRIQVSPTPEYMEQHRSMQSWGFLSAGLLATSMLGGIMLLVTGYTAQVEATVKTRTLELTRERDKSQMLARKAEEANRAKSLFLSNMSHELHTPMNGIIGMIHLALQTQLDGKQQNFIHKANQSAKKLLGILNNILDFSKMEAGKLNIESVGFQLEDVINNMVNLIKLKAEEKVVELSIRIHRDVPRALVGDPLRLGQVLVNLGGNAVKFSKFGDSVCLKIILKEETEQDVFLQFSVQDTGIGISEEQQEHLFEAFSQSDGSTTRTYGGTGLGLAISKNIVQMMGGDIWVESERGVGSTFHFTVRLSKQQGTPSA
jgi:signal transduction histidine kinase